MTSQLLAMLGLACTSFMLMLFAFGLLHKVAEFERFTGFVAAYRLLPAATVRMASRLLIAMECMTLALLVWQPTRALGLGVAAALLLLYAVAIAANVLRGRTHIDCGCGGAAHPVSAALALRNLCLAILAFGAAGLVSDELDGMQAFVALAVGVMAWLIFQLAAMALNSLLRGAANPKNKDERTSP